MSGLNLSAESPTDGLQALLGARVHRYLDGPDVLDIFLNPDGRVWLNRHSSGMEEVGFAIDPTRAEAPHIFVWPPRRRLSRRTSYFAPARGAARGALLRQPTLERHELFLERFDLRLLLLERPHQIRDQVDRLERLVADRLDLYAPVANLRLDARPPPPAPAALRPPAGP